MPLPTGSRLGAYEVVSALGAGGMGEVYRAHDTKLGRDVALKILPDAFAGDSDRLMRFEREARTLAALNHPHIAQIHGLEEANGTRALVMELVQGEDLSARIGRGPIPLDEALPIARQIAEALEAAHELGIIHRDLKPSNIKLRDDGTVKVLDFGLAKALDASPAAAATDNSPTITSPAMTRAGMILGTAAYMAPEQARGKPLDKRADIWAFGVVFYEMLSGRRPFSGDGVTDTIVAILGKDPDWSLLPTGQPAVASVVRRCLEKDPKRRLRDIGDARLEIEEVERSLRSESPPDVQRPALESARLRRGGRRTLGWMALAGVVALALVALLFSRRSDDSAPEIRLQLAPPPGTRFVSVPAVSPDGREIVFVAAPEAGGEARLWRRPLGAAAATEVPGTGAASYPFWSADGRAVAFFAAGQLKRVAIAGGNPVVVCEVPAGRGGLWLDDDTIVFSPTANSPLLRVSVAGGSPEPLTALTEAETSHRFPHRLPGRQLLYFSVNRAPEKSGTRLVALDDPNREIAFIPTRGAAEYVNGFLVFTPPHAGPAPVLAQRMTLPGGQLSGEPIEIGETRISETLGRFVVATAPGGVVAMLGPAEGIGQFTWIDRDGRVLDTVGPPTSQFGVELSPDRKQLATYRSGEIWTMDLARPVPIRVTAGGPNRHPIWSPDGTHMLTLLQGRGIGTFDLVTTTITTGGVATALQGANMQKPMGWTRDGRLVWIAAEVSGSGATSIVTMLPGNEPVLILHESTQTYEARVSPDSRWIAFASNRSGRYEIEVSRFPEGGTRYPVSVDGGGYPRWRADGRELYFLSADGRLMATTFSAGPRPAIGRPTPLFEARLNAHPDRGIFAGYEYDVAADGSRFLINRLVSPPEASMTVIVGWNPMR